MSLWTELHEIFNLGCGNPRMLMDFIHRIEECCQKKAEIKLMPLQPGDVLRTSADISKATHLLGFVPKVSMEEGVSKFVEWYRSFY